MGSDSDGMEVNLRDNDDSPKKTLDHKYRVRNRDFDIGVWPHIEGRVQKVHHSTCE